jgi:hypothetical protein
MIGSKIVGVDCDNNYFSGFLHKDGTNLFRRVNFAIPRLAVPEILSTIQSPELRRVPWTGSNRLLHLGKGETALAHVTQGVVGKSNRLH